MFNTQSVITKNIYGISEAVILLLLGGALLWFSVFGQYELLMNAKFKWLTIAGAAMVLVMGLVILFSVSQQRSGVNTAFFGLMFLIIIVGQPHLPNKNLEDYAKLSLPAGIWDQIDQTRFPEKKLTSLVTKLADEIYENRQSFTTIGIVKRLESLDVHGSFAIIAPLMFCCLADSIGTGFRVPDDGFKNLQDGQSIMISGRLAKEGDELDIPNFRFGKAMLSSVDKTYYLRPEKIMSYNRRDQLPLLTQKIINDQNGQLFGKALEKSGILKELEKEGPFTIFLPVNQAIEILDDNPLDELAKNDLKQFVLAHIVKGQFNSRDLASTENLSTLNNKELQIKYNFGVLKVNHTRVLLRDIEAKNGVIHFIYPTILPTEINTNENF